MNLKTFFEKYHQVVLAYSGGVDSSYLLYAANFYQVDLKVIYIKSVFQPEFELVDAKRLCNELKIKLDVVEVDILNDEMIVNNPSNRCYYCKKVIFNKIIEMAKKSGYEYIIDGTNASDKYDDRPGMKVLKDLKILSPLRMCNLGKKEVRELSKQANLFTYDKPSYSCLATRIPTCQKINKDLLKRIENSESSLMQMGFKDFRVRVLNDCALLQFRSKDFLQVIKQRETIVDNIKKYFKRVLFDLEGRKDESE